MQLLGRLGESPRRTVGGEARWDGLNREGREGKTTVLMCFLGWQAAANVDSDGLTVEIKLQMACETFLVPCCFSGTLVLSDMPNVVIGIQKEKTRHLRSLSLQRPQFVPALFQIARWPVSRS